MGKIHSEEPKIKIIASSNTWIEGKAVEQLNETASLPGMMKVVGLPDLHPGKGSPIGAAFLSKGVLYPFLVGSDIGCGMGLWQTDLHSKKLKLDRWEKKLTGLETQSEDEISEWLNNEKCEPTAFDGSLGTIGGGNHFAELQVIDKVFDSAALLKYNMDQNRLVLLVHSGSRGLGNQILQEHIDKFQAQGLESASKGAMEYMEKHDKAMDWAKLNRLIIASRFCSKLGTSLTPVLDVWHNSVCNLKNIGADLWLHRKGAAPSDQGPIVIPGSRGTLSYLVQPTGDLESSNFSLAHGAGRKWRRSECKGRLKDKFRAETLTRTHLGSRVICEDKNLLYQEAPQAYKNIDHIVETLESENLINLIASMRPVITYKTRKA